MLRTVQLLPQQALDPGLRPRPFPTRAASLLPGLLTATRTGGRRLGQLDRGSIFPRHRPAGVVYPTREQARTDITRYIEFWYNTKRLHSSLGYKTPQEALQQSTQVQEAA